MSVDAECLTALPDRSSTTWRAADLTALLEEIATAVPWLAGPTGLFTGYGRVYLDGGHVELAAAECASPYEVPVLLEALQRVASSAAARLHQRGVKVLLGTSVHGGRLQPGTPGWGAHENYLLGTPPDRLVDRALPFLVTRFQGGAGGVWAPSGAYLACSRLTMMSTDWGGGTTERRALFSNARQEHHCGGRPGHYRAHLILGDGHRSHFNQAFHLGTTALVLRAIEAMPEAVAPLRRCPGADQARFWLASARALNELAPPGRPLRVHPLALDVQRFYHDLAARFARRLEDPPAWVDRLLSDWAETLSRLRDGDEDWAARRLDPWIKHRLFSAWLARQGADWSSLAGRPDLLDGLALLDQDYHLFTGEDPLFDRIERAGMLDHRTASRVEPGFEPSPFVPDLSTRARARARFILANSGDLRFVMDWSAVLDRSAQRAKRLDDPFATAFQEWSPGFAV